MTPARVAPTIQKRAEKRNIVGATLAGVYTSRVPHKAGAGSKNLHKGGQGDRKGGKLNPHKAGGQGDRKGRPYYIRGC